MKNKCQVCSLSNTKKYFVSNKTTYYHCQSCGFVYANKLPVTSYVDWDKSMAYSKWEEYLKNIYLRMILDIQKYRKKGNVLEIGSSLGFMLETLNKMRFNAEGIEPSTDAVKFSRKKGLKVHSGYFENASIRNSSFDIIIANHVLEHIKSTGVFLTKANKVLKKNGLIVIALPNFDSLEAQLFKSKWRFLMPDEHYYQFTPETLSKLLENNGFKVLDIKTTTAWTEFGSLKNEIVRSIVKDQKRFIYYLLEFIPASLQHFLNRGVGLQIIARKT